MPTGTFKQRPPIWNTRTWCMGHTCLVVALQLCMYCWILHWMRFLFLQWVLRVFFVVVFRAVGGLLSCLYFFNQLHWLIFNCWVMAEVVEGFSFVFPLFAEQWDSELKQPWCRPASCSYWWPTPCPTNWLVAGFVAWWGDLMWFGGGVFLAESIVDPSSFVSCCWIILFWA